MINQRGVIFYFNMKTKKKRRKKKKKKMPLNYPGYGPVGIYIYIYIQFLATSPYHIQDDINNTRSVLYYMLGIEPRVKQCNIIMLGFQVFFPNDIRLIYIYIYI